MPPGSRAFNPLFIGSKDATADSGPGRGTSRPFQSPFHRVKGCNYAATIGAFGAVTSFQSPFHRVKGCNSTLPYVRPVPHMPFNPLFIGSKDATCCTIRCCHCLCDFQSPFHRVKGCNFPPRPASASLMRPFQSPFHRVKGCNHSLLLHVTIAKETFNPLFIGSKDATRRPARHAAGRPGAFNPLFIGSKDATGNRKERRDGDASFNPLFIGSKDATMSERVIVTRHPAFNPLFIGSKDATGPALGMPRKFMLFQSPFHRVKGCNRLTLPPALRRTIDPFNPLFIGSKDATGMEMPWGEEEERLSIPFSSGQRMQRSDYFRPAPPA